jgi:hypothetical protein
MFVVFEIVNHIPFYTVRNRITFAHVSGRLNGRFFREKSADSQNFGFRCICTGNGGINGIERV